MRNTLPLYGLIFLCLPHWTSAQQCKLFTDKVDEFTGDTVKTTDFIVAGKTQAGSVLNIAASRTGNLYTIHFFPKSQSGCSTRDSYALILFEDSSKLQLPHIGKIDCSSPSIHARVEGSELMEKDAKRVRLVFSEGYRDYTVDADVFRRALQCVR